MLNSDDSDVVIGVVVDVRKNHLLVNIGDADLHGW